MKKSFEIKVLSGVHGGARASLPVGRTVIGSADDCDVVLSADDVLAHHAAVTVADDGLTVTPLEGEVSRADGSLVTDEEPLSQHSPFGLGASILAVGEAGAPWPRLDISRFGRVSPGSRQEAAAGSPADGSAAAERDRAAMDGPASQPAPTMRGAAVARPLGTRIGGMTLYPLAALLLAGIGFIGFSWFTAGDAATGDQSAQATRSAPQVTVVDRLVEALEEAGVPTAHLVIRQLSENSALVTGYLELFKQQETLKRVVAGLGADVAARVWSQDALVAQARQRLADLAGGVRVESVEPGVVAVSGYLANDSRRSRILAAVREDVPGLRDVVDRLTGPRDLERRLQDAVAASPLAGQIVVEADGEGDVMARGVLGQAGLDTWNGMVDALETELGAALPVRTAFVPLASDLPFTIRGIIAGPMRYVITATGRRVGEGGNLGGGFSVERISDGEVTINGRGQRFVQRLKE